MRLCPPAPTDQAPPDPFLGGGSPVHPPKFYNQVASDNHQDYSLIHFLPAPSSSLSPNTFRFPSSRRSYRERGSRRFSVVRRARRTTYLCLKFPPFARSNHGEEILPLVQQAPPSPPTRTRSATARLPHGTRQSSPTLVECGRMRWAVLQDRVGEQERSLSASTVWGEEWHVSWSVPPTRSRGPAAFWSAFRKCHGETRDGVRETFVCWGCFECGVGH